MELRDAVYLRNGSIIRGTIIAMIPDSTIRIQTRDESVFVYPMKDVEKILKEETPSQPREFSATEPHSVRRSKAHLGLLFGYGAKDGYHLGFGLRIGERFHPERILASCSFIIRESHKIFSITWVLVPLIIVYS